jgi:Na+/melibiose symporter-like transporter
MAAARSAAGGGFVYYVIGCLVFVWIFIKFRQVKERAQKKKKKKKKQTP